MIARGAISSSHWTPLRSPLADVSDAAWTEFVRLMRTGPASRVTKSGALGAWEMRPRRLDELGIRNHPREEMLQYAVFEVSCRQYDALTGGRPGEWTRSEAIAFLHRTCPRDVVRWNKKLTGTTRALCTAVRGCF